MRVIARLHNDSADIGSPRTRQRFTALAQEMLDVRAPGAFNQALMELGATVCLPRAPQCLLCPLSGECRARREGTAAQLPVKLRKTVPQRIEETLLVIEKDGRVLLRQRPADAGRMAGFWELPSPEHLPGARPGAQIGTFRHTITHHLYRFTVRTATLKRVPREFRWFAHQEFRAIPLSTTSRKALQLVREFTALVPNLL